MIKSTTTLEFNRAMTDQAALLSTPLARGPGALPRERQLIHNTVRIRNIQHFYKYFLKNM